MDYAQITVGFILMITGILLWQHPGLISWYGRLAEDNNLEHSTRLLRNVMLMAGVLLIAGTFLFNFLHLNHIAHILFPLIIIPATIIVVIKL